MTVPHLPEDPSTPGFSTPGGTRRRFFQWAIAACAGLIGLGLAVPLVGYVISPALKRREQDWVPVGTLKELRVDQPTQLDYVRTLQDGYLTTKAHKAVWAINRTQGDVTVFSPICPHLGCGYRWDSQDQRFKCPCHASVFDISGKVVAGPAPRPLDELPVKVEGGEIYVIYKEFRAGLSKKVEV
ncbi:MAG: ubiquinol-cytochrome c reductase iron-sulfur subunit [Nitrospirales bacterium]